MKRKEFRNACDELVAVAKEHGSPEIVLLCETDRERLKPLADALWEAMTRGTPLPKRAGGRPIKHSMGTIGDGTLRGWHVQKFIEAVNTDGSIDGEIFTKVSVAAFAVQHGADPVKAFSINDGKPENRGMSPLGTHWHELDVAIEVAKAVEFNKTHKNRSSKYGRLKTNIYNGVGKKFGLSPTTVRDSYRRTLASEHTVGDNEEEKNRWLSCGAVNLGFAMKYYKSGTTPKK